MSAIIVPLNFIHSRLSTVSRAPSQTGHGWYTVCSQPGGKWTAANSRTGFIGSYTTERESVVACGAVDVNRSVEWLRQLP